jgi:hypothetical protein
MTATTTVTINLDGGQASDRTAEIAVDGKLPSVISVALLDDGRVLIYGNSEITEADRAAAMGRWQMYCLDIITGSRNRYYCLR